MRNAFFSLRLVHNHGKFLKAYLTEPNGQGRQLIFTVLLATLTSVALAATPSQILIQNDIKRLAAMFGDEFSTNYPAYTHIEFGKIFGGNQEDAVAIFSIEGFDGGNDDHQYLAFFKSTDTDPTLGRQPRPFRLVSVSQIGGRGWRYFDYQRIKQIGSNSVTLRGEKYGPTDAMFCPSVPIQVTFYVTNGFISEPK
jgi:hypothetical protein